MTEMLVAVGDALDRALLRVVPVTLQGGKLPDLPRPSYLPPAPVVPVNKAAQRARMDALIAKSRRR